MVNMVVSCRKFTAHLSGRNSRSEIDRLQSLGSEVLGLAVVVAFEDLDPVVVLQDGRTDPMFHGQAEPGFDAQTVFDRSLAGLLSRLREYGRKRFYFIKMVQRVSDNWQRQSLDGDR